MSLYRSGFHERRSVYRISQSLDGIDVTLAWDGSESRPGKVVDLTAQGAAIQVEFPLGDAPELSEDATVDLILGIPDTERLLCVLAVIRHQWDTHGARVFGLRIIEWQKLHDRLPTHYFAKFNRRRRYRLGFSRASAPDVVVRVLPNGQSTTATFVNLSVEGCQLAFGQDGAPEVDTPLQLEFRLPETDYQFVVRGNVVSAFSADGESHRGVEFDVSRSPEFSKQEPNLSYYIVKQQQR